MIRTLWQAASRPEVFFRRLEPLEPQIPRAFLSALASVLFSLVVASLLFARLTNSTGILPILLFGLVAGGFTWLLVWALGRPNVTAAYKARHTRLGALCLELGASRHHGTLVTAGCLLLSFTWPNLWFSWHIGVAVRATNYGPTRFCT